jgi:RNA polymerase sigma factor (sigma-70 family)
MNYSDDNHHIQLVLNGDTNAFSALVDRYKNMVFTLCLKLVKSREEAEDLSQECFIKVFKSLGSFKKEARFSTWLYTITYHTCLDRIKKLKKEQSIVNMDSFTENEVASLQHNMEALQEKERKELVKECLDLLNEEERWMLTLFYLEEQSIKEIAMIMGISETNTKVKIFRSRKKLVGLLQSQKELEIFNQYATEK